MVPELALDIGEQAAGAETEQLRRHPLVAQLLFGNISQSSACLAVLMPPAGLKPTL
jgi:hypothetical protein